jgi:hypothetical protein
MTLLFKKRPSSSPSESPSKNEISLILSFLWEPFSPAQVRARIQWAKNKLNPDPEKLVLLHVELTKQVV